MCFKERAHRRFTAGGRSRHIQAAGATRLPWPLPRALGKQRGFVHGYCSTIWRVGQTDMRSGQSHLYSMDRINKINRIVFS